MANRKTKEAFSRIRMAAEAAARSSRSARSRRLPTCPEGMVYGPPSTPHRWIMPDEWHGYPLTLREHRRQMARAAKLRGPKIIVNEKSDE